MPGGAGSTSAATGGAAQEPAAPAGHGEDDSAGTDEGDEAAAEPAGSEVPPLDESGSRDQDETPAAPPQERRISNFDEVRDGGFGIGSAAPLDDRAQPLGHAVKGYRDSSTFLAPGAAGYEDREPDVWFFNEEAARRAGFNPAGE